MQRDDAYLLDILIAARKALKNAHVRARHSTQIPPLAHISASYQMHPAMQDVRARHSTQIPPLAHISASYQMHPAMQDAQDALGNALPLHLTWRQQ